MIVLKKFPYTFLVVLADFASAILAWFLFYQMRKYFGEFNESAFFSLFLSGFTIGAFWIMIYAFFGFYRDVLLRSRIKEIFQILSISLVGAAVILLTLALYLVVYMPENAQFINYAKNVFIYFLVHSAVTLVVKTSLLTYYKRLIYRKVISYRTLIIGSEKNALDLYEEMEHYPNLGISFYGYVHVKEENAHELEGVLRHLGGSENLPEKIKSHAIERVIIAVEPSEHQMIAQILNQLEGLNLKISLIPDIYQILLGSVKVSHVLGTALVEVKQKLLPIWQEVIKRIMDVVVSLLVLLLGSPFYFLVGLIIKFTSKGPVIFSQERIGKGGKPFTIFKFRTMRVDAEKERPMLSRKNDPRITPVGRILRKTRIDEFPQFYNVLIGDMSLVGPRPERQFWIDQIVQKAPHYRHLHKVRPGITSLGQVKYGYASNVEEMVKRLKYEVIYIENMSLFMDLRIMIYTVLIMIQGRGK